MNLTILYNKTVTHRITIARDHSVRIKIAIGTSLEDSHEVIKMFTKIAEQVLPLELKTMRGKLCAEFNEVEAITLYNDSKKEFIRFNLKEL